MVPFLNVCSCISLVLKMITAALILAERQRLRLDLLDRWIVVKIDTFSLLVDDLDIALCRIVVCSRVVEDGGELACGIL